MGVAAAMADLNFNRTPHVAAVLGFASSELLLEEDAAIALQGRKKQWEEEILEREREESYFGREREREKRLEKEVSALGITQSSKTWHARSCFIFIFSFFR